MGKPLRVVVVGDSHDAALKVVADLEQAGYEPSVFLAPGESDLERLQEEEPAAEEHGVQPRR